MVLVQSLLFVTSSLLLTKYQIETHFVINQANTQINQKVLK